MKGIIVNGPNLNMLGKRNQSHYGPDTLDSINQYITKTFPNVHFEFYQSNHEGDLIDCLQQASGDFLVMNPGGLSHYSIALRDAFELVKMKKAIVHLSDIEQRETFRQLDLFKPLADVYIKGLKKEGYIEAIKALI